MSFSQCENLCHFLSLYLTYFLVLSTFLRFFKGSATILSYDDFSERHPISLTAAIISHFANIPAMGSNVEMAKLMYFPPLLRPLSTEFAKQQPK